MLMSSLMVVVSLLAIYIGLIVYGRAHRQSIHSSFFMLTIIAAVWNMASYFGGHLSEGSVSIILVRLDYTMGLAMTWALAHFTTTLRQSVSDKRKLTSWLTIIHGIFGVSVLLVNSPLVLRVVDSTVKEASGFAVLYLVPQLLFILWSMANLFMAFYTAKGVDRDRVRVILVSLLVAAIMFGVPYLVLDALIDRGTILRQLQEIGNLGMIVFIIGSAYAIIRHHMFDIRAAAARATTYILSLASIGGLYFLVAFSIFNTTLNGNGWGTKLLYLSFALITSVIYQPTKRFFDRATNAIFYRDAYEPQELYNELNYLLATSSDLNHMLGAAATILQKHLKTEFVIFGLRESGSRRPRLIGTDELVYSDADLALLRSITVKSNDTVIMGQELAASSRAQHSSRMRHLINILDKYSIGVLTRLTDRKNDGKEADGYILFGSKKSGNSFTQRDKQVIDIINNELFIAIQNALRFEEIQQFNITLQQKVDTATRQLRKTNQKLEALDQAKDEFISMASHQLRTPLTSIKGYLSMVIDGDAGKLTKLQHSMLSQGFSSAQQMVYLIGDLLNVSRLQTGKFVIDATPVNLADVIEEELAIVAASAGVKGVGLDFKKPADFPLLQLDDTKIRQVIMNFLDNAVYYTPAGGTVKIELEEAERAVELRIIDSGIGVPKADQHKLFTKFFRASNARKARPDGTGLGLFMAQKVIVASGGAIIFHSKEGEGSTFGFSFPRTPR